MWPWLRSGYTLRTARKGEKRSRTVSASYTKNWTEPLTEPVDISSPVWKRVIRTAIEYLAVFISTMAFIAAFGAFLMNAWSSGYNQGSIDAMNHRITDFITQQNKTEKDLTERIDVVDIRVTNLDAKINARDE